MPTAAEAEILNQVYEFKYIFINALWRESCRMSGAGRLSPTFSIEISTGRAAAM
jgi:hypothetical protein